VDQSREQEVRRQATRFQRRKCHANGCIVTLNLSATRRVCSLTTAVPSLRRY
jgi:hypothetical protein